MGQPHRILFVSHAVEWGGAEVVLADLWTALDRSRFELHLCCPREGPLSLRARELDVAVHHLAMGFAGPVQKALSLPGAARRLGALVRERGIALVHANTMIAGYAGVMGRRTGHPVLWHLHVAVRSLVARLFLRRADAVVTPSRAAAAHVPGSVARRGRLHVVQNGVPDRFFKALPPRRGLRQDLGVPVDAPLCGLVGRLDPHKGHDVFLDAAAQIRRTLPEAHFVIAGGDALTDSLPRVRGYQDALQARAMEPDLAGAIHFLGHVEDTASLLAELDVMAVPSVTPEAAPRTVAEAMAAGCPVVASRVGGIPEMITDGRQGLLVPPGDPGALAVAIIRLLHDPKAAEGMAGAARLRATEEWSLESFAARIAEVYALLIT